MDPKRTGVELDPQLNVFRRLHQQEIPAAIKAIKGAESVTVVLREGTG